MIEIDIAPAPASAPSSPSVPQGAADDFASALENAGGRDERSPATRSSDGARSDDPGPAHSNTSGWNSRIAVRTQAEKSNVSTTCA